MEQPWRSPGGAVGQSWDPKPEPPCAGLSPSVGSRGGGILPLCPSAETPPAELPQPWDQHRKELELLQPGQRRLQDEQRDGAALLGGKAARAGIVQPGQEKLWGDLSVALWCLKGLQERWRETIAKGWRDRTRGMASQCQGAGMDGKWGRVGRPWHRVPRGAVAAPGSVAVSKWLDTGAWSSLGQQKVSLPMAEVLLDGL
ncbi:hypothetical protein DUI87_31257 [Hirundo rustica rustica]|uniref:Uncharacterized protein n=1 Tax=Hirundo rustica rustica TaxID=333673 RepID=A0A3M0IV97_HIRRU|nr:hypothetical protein DUI87_31257 [Hirundo rustica rustica]